MTECSNSGGRECCPAIRSTASSMPAGGSAAGATGAAAAVTARGSTTVAATGLSGTVLGVTITLLTNLPLRGSARTTDVMRFGGAGTSPPNAAPASHPPIDIIKQNRMKMFRFSVKLKPQDVANSNGIISL